MKVWEEKNYKLRMPKSHGRSVGLHVSEVIRDLAFSGNVLDKKWLKEIALELQDTSLMQVGFAWENYLEWSNQHPEIEYHPGELSIKTDVCTICGEEREDHVLGDYDHEFIHLVIYLSPDGFTWDKDGVVLVYLNEIKFTKKTCRDFAQGIRMGSKKSIMWIWQIMSYLKATGTLDAKLEVMFINGNYSYSDTDPESGAVPKIFRLQFTQEEIDSNWRMILNHASTMVKNGKYKHAA